MREVLIGFDSAWTDSPKNPGAVAACVLENGRFTEDHLPRLATFADALASDHGLNAPTSSLSHLTNRLSCRTTTGAGRSIA